MSTRNLIAALLVAVFVTASSPATHAAEPARAPASIFIIPQALLNEFKDQRPCRSKPEPQTLQTKLRNLWDEFWYRPFTFRRGITTATAVGIKTR